MESMTLNNEILYDLDKIKNKIVFAIELDQLSGNDLSEIAHILININKTILDKLE